MISIVKSIKDSHLGDFLRWLKGTEVYLPLSLRYGSEFKKTLLFLRSSQYWNTEKILDYQLQSFKKLFSTAYNYSPYYQNKFDEYGVNINDIRCFDDIKKVPILEKSEIQHNLQQMLCSNYRGKIKYLTTGGSTGTPVGFYWQDPYTMRQEIAFLWFLWSLKKIKPSDRWLIIRGEELRENKLFHRKSFNRLHISSYHLTDNNIKHILKKIESFSPHVIQAFPSSLYQICKWIKDNNYKISFSLKAILTSSETLYPYQETVFENIFKTQTFDLYGNSERTVMANRCEYNTLHLMPFYGLTELLKKNNEWCTRNGETGEIISTGFNNYALPFIRYRTGDLGINSTDKCKCGRNFQSLLRIEGRLQEFIVGKSGQKISMSLLNTHSSAFDNVSQFQFYQNKKSFVILRLIKKAFYSDSDTFHIEKEMKNKLGNDFNLKICFVDKISRTPSGKIKLLVQEYIDSNIVK